MTKAIGLRQRVGEWLAERIPVAELVDHLARKTVPRHSKSFWYLFGGLTLFLFIVQVVTGMLLALYYKPSPSEAHESVLHIMHVVPYGWLVRSIHSWAANLMVATMLIHMFSVFLLKAYRRPREILWVSGVLLMFLVFGFGFTGYLLPWDTVAYFATLIGTEVPKTLPIIGDWGVTLLKGGDEVGAETLSRMYALHVIILPLITFAVVSFHLLLNQQLGSSIPIGVRAKEPPIPFFPNFLYRDLIAWTIGFAALFVIATLSPWGLGEKADPLASAPLGIKPEWYFLPLYQVLKMTPAKVFSVSGELVVNSIVVLTASLWVLVPFLDRKASRDEQSRLFTAIGVLLIAFVVFTILIAYLSP